MWLKLPSTALVHGLKGLGLQLPTCMVPRRWTLKLRAMPAPKGGFYIDALHMAVYEKARKGQYAWQAPTTYNRHDTANYIIWGLRYAHAVVPDSAIDCDGFTWNKVRSAVQSDSAEIYVRPTSTGFRFLVNPPYAPKHVVNQVPQAWIKKMATDPRHGSPQAPLPSDCSRTPHYKINGSFPLQWSPQVKENLIQAMSHEFNCRCIINQEGNIDMRKIDTSTSNDLPFGLIAGEKIVQCEFTDAGYKQYAYFAGDLEVAEGDYVVVASPNGDGVFDEESGGYLTVVRVTSVDANPEGIRKAAKWIISKVDVSAYRARREKLEQLKTLDEQIKLAEREARAKLDMLKLRELSLELAELIDKRMTLTA